MEEIKITDYAIQSYFEVEYNDLRNRKHRKIYEVSNNHNFYLINGKISTRYFHDNALNEIKFREEPNIISPIFNPEDIVFEIVKDYDLFINNFEEQDTADEVHYFYVLNSENEKELISKRNVEYSIKDENGLLIGFREVSD